MKPSPYHLPYNPELVERARELRKNPTPAEAKLWSYLKTLNVRILRQRPIGNFIVDFYCPAALLVIEVDGESHDGLEVGVYDLERTQVLASHGLNVVRVTNSEVFGFGRVCRRMRALTEVPNPPTPLEKGGLPFKRQGKRFSLLFLLFPFLWGQAQHVPTLKVQPPF